MAAWTSAPQATAYGIDILCIILPMEELLQWLLHPTKFCGLANKDNIMDIHVKLPKPGSGDGVEISALLQGIDLD